MSWKIVAGWMLAAVWAAEFVTMVSLDSFGVVVADAQLEALVDSVAVGAFSLCAYLALLMIDRRSMKLIRAGDWYNGLVIVLTVIGFESVFHPLSENVSTLFTNEVSVELVNSVLLAIAVACVCAWIHAIDQRVTELVPSRKVFLKKAGPAVLIGVLVSAICVSSVAALREVNQRMFSHEVGLGAALGDAVAHQREASHSVGRAALMSLQTGGGSLPFVNAMGAAGGRASITQNLAAEYFRRNESELQKLVRRPSLASFDRAWGQVVDSARVFSTAGETSKREAALALQFSIDEFAYSANAMLNSIAILESRRAVHHGSVIGEIANGVLVFLMAAGLLLPLLRLTGAQMSRLGASLSDAQRLNGNLAAYKRALDEHAIFSVTDQRGKILQANEHFLAISKYTHEEVISQNHRIVSSGMHGPDFFAGMWKTISRGDTWRGEVCNRAVDGSLYWVDVCITPLMGTDGTPEQYVSIGYDITERKGAEERFERKIKLSRAIEAMRSEFMVHDSVYATLTPVLNEINAVMGSNASLVVELARNREGCASALMLGHSKSERAGDDALTGTQPRLTNPEGQHELIEEALSLGEMFGGLGAKQLGADEFTGFPIAVGFDPVGLLLVSGDIDRVLFDDEITITVNALAEIVSARRESDRRRADEEGTKKLAKRDPLTGLGNRRDLEEEFESRTDHPDAQFGLLLIDLDRFKPINDTFGHLVGDTVLRVVAERLVAMAKGDYTVSRIGGDEFAILTESHAVLNEHQALELARRVIEELCAPVQCGQYEVSVGASVGVALYPRHGHTFQEIFHCADAAMYRAKENRSEAKMFDASMDEGIRHRAELETDLKRALEQDEIVPYFQPFVDLSSGKVVGHEVLARWTHSVRGDVAPSEFIKIAEEAGLVDRLFWQILSRACKMHVSGRHKTTLSVNLSPTQINNPLFARHLIEQIEQLGFPANLLEVEITETSMIGDLNRARPLLLLLKSCGIQIALDDFGTGYSSLALLRSLPISKLKIDHSFTADLESQDATRGTIIDAILGIAKAMHLKVTAEGIETPEVADYLRAQGCHYGQGYLFSKGVPQILTEVSEGGPTAWRNSA